MISAAQHPKSPGRRTGVIEDPPARRASHCAEWRDAALRLRPREGSHPSLFSLSPPHIRSGGRLTPSLRTR